MGFKLAEEKLINFLKTGKDWSRLATTIPGVFVLKLPAYKRQPSRLAVELNPVDEDGKPKKRRGLVLRSSEELKVFRDLIQEERLTRLMEMIDSVNPKVEAARRRREEVIEI